MSAYSGAVLGGSGGVTRFGTTASSRRYASLASAEVMWPPATIWFSVYFWRPRACAKSRTGFHTDGAGAIPASIEARASATTGSGGPAAPGAASPSSSTPTPK